MDITKLSLVELQSLAYTFIEAREVADLNLKATNTEIAKRREEIKKAKEEGTTLAQKVEEVEVATN